MKRIIKEQSVPSANALNTNGIINEPFNTYKDPQNREFIETFTILSLNQGTQGSFNIEVKDNQGNRDKFFFKCSDAGLGQDGYSNSLYSNNLVNELKKRYCTKSTGGAEVPNATFASNTNKAPQTNAMAEGKRIVKLTEADLTRLVKKVIKEQQKFEVDPKDLEMPELPDEETLKKFEKVVPDFKNAMKACVAENNLYKVKGFLDGVETKKMNIFNTIMANLFDRKAGGKSLNQEFNEFTKCINQKIGNKLPKINNIK